MEIHTLPLSLRQISFALIIALTAVFAKTLFGQNSPCLFFPPPGLDESQSLGYIIMNIVPLGQKDTVFVSGPTVISRNDMMIDPTGKHFVPTQIVSMNLQGTSQLLGQVFVRLNPDMPSIGQITALQIEPDFPASSYFDVFVEVTALGIALHNVEPLHVEAEIRCIPPYGEPYQHFPGTGVNLFNAAGTPIATIVEAAHKLETPVFSVIPGGNLDLALLGPLEFGGRAFFGAGIAEPRPPAMGWPPIGRIEPPLLGLVPGAPGAIGDNLDGLSFGMDDIMAEATALEVFSFSVDNGSIGAPLSSVRFEFTAGTTFGPPDMPAPPEQVADVFFSPMDGNNYPMLDEKDPTCATANMTVTNAIPTASACTLPGNPPFFWLGGANPENTDAIEISNVFQVGVDLDGDGKLDALIAPVFFSIGAGSASVGAAVPDFRPAPPDGIASPDDILVAQPPGGFFGVFASGTLDIGLQAGDDVDAICLWDKAQLGFLDPSVDEAYFSLTPASPSLGVNSPADIFYTNFNGTFSLFTAAATIGLLSGDNVDALDCQCLNREWVDVENIPDGKGQGFKLYPGVPNPFSTSVAVTFDIPQHSYVTVKIYNLLGDEITALVNEKLAPGTYRTAWDAAGREKGVYFCTLQAGAFRETVKLMLLK